MSGAASPAAPLVPSSEEAVITMPSATDSPGPRRHKVRRHITTGADGQAEHFVTCRCGWSTVQDTVEEARDAHIEHLLTYAPEQVAGVLRQDDHQRP